MCGCYGFHEGQAKLREALSLTDQPPPTAQRYNLAPTQTAPVVRQDGEGRRLEHIRWGVLLEREGRAGLLAFNIRAETRLKNGLWRSRLLKARLIAPASHFYEWVVDPGSKVKTPLLIRRRDGDPICFAAVAAHSDHEPAGHAFTLITTEVPPELAHIRSRWPAVIDEDAMDTWFDPSLDALFEQLMPAPAGWFEYFLVGPGVNNVANDSPALAVPRAV